MQSFIKSKESYDRKANAAPLKENEYCCALQPRTDHQGSKYPFRDYRWIGPFIVQKVISIEKLHCAQAQNKQNSNIEPHSP